MKVLPEKEIKKT